MTLIVCGLLLGMVALMWMLVLAILQGDQEHGETTMLRGTVPETPSGRHEKKTAA
jgi:hypothetical protein